MESAEKNCQVEETVSENMTANVDDEDIRSPETIAQDLELQKAQCVSFRTILRVNTMNQ